MANPKYLIQEVKGQEPYVYDWTPVLAVRKDMRPIPAKEAEDLLKQQRKTKEQKLSDAIEEPVELPEVPEDTENEGDQTLDEFVSDAEEIPVEKEEEGKPLSLTQSELFDKDMAVINQKRKRETIEEYILKKYKLEMLQMDSVDGMKQQAASLLEVLAQNDQLYETK